MTQPRIAFVCLTYGRPVQLGRILRMFTKQTYPNCELVILDDAYQYPSCPSGDRWRVVSVKKRYPNLGAKRNAAVKLISQETTLIQTTDDDDWYLPDCLAAAAHALSKGSWAQPRQALEYDGKSFRRFETFGRKDLNNIAYNGSWAFRVAEFWKVGGYFNHPDDDRISQKMMAAYGPSIDVICAEFPSPQYAYSRVPEDKHLSWGYAEYGMQRSWDRLAVGQLPPTELTIGPDIDFSAIPIPKTAEPRAW